MQKILKLIDEKKGADTIIYAAEDSPLATDYIIITSADNPRKIKAIARNLEDHLPYEPFAVEGTGAAAWIVMDYGDFIIHIFGEETRSFYDLEGLFGEPLWRAAK